MSLINSFKIFREVYLLSGDVPYESLYMLQHYMNNTFASLDYQKLSAAAIIMAIVMVLIIGILFFADDKYGRMWRNERKKALYPKNGCRLDRSAATAFGGVRLSCADDPHHIRFVFYAVGIKLQLRQRYFPVQEAVIHT